MNILQIKLIKKLRIITGLGIKECKTSLIKSNWNLELAIDELRKISKTIAFNKAIKLVKKGIILTKHSKNLEYGIILEVNTETDFFSKDLKFINFCNDIANLCLIKKYSKLEHIKNKFENKRISLVSQSGENIKIHRLKLIKGKKIFSYSHLKKIGVLIDYIGDNNIIKKIAMHIIAENPLFLNIKNISDKIIKREYKIQKAISLKLNKSKDILDKIISGKIKKFVHTISLMNQNFIFNPNQTVKEFLKQYNMKINSFIRFELGEELKD